MDMALGDLLDVPQNMQAVTVAQLITHTSGISPDSTQNNPDLHNAQADQTQNVSQQALNRNIQKGEVGTAAYNNENYAFLPLRKHLHWKIVKNRFTGKLTPN